ncbi:MAG TPA: HD domain-containing protein [Candidatus Omnitrophota bacterium]|jgi:HD-GYP domain-containing protein (c-di-GMP phosphodiesterase class II)|nr:HD domain-containing protein [Candidatus Omnitrophota bacterium]HPN55434.1 HD domain-containing protein [Candidatus Omnitrophota bacterium]
MSYKIKLTSFENASLLRKLSILYFLMSIIPIAFLYFLYLQLVDYGRIIINEERFSSIFFLVVIGVAVGYVVMRSIIMSIIDITRENRDALKELLGPEKIKALSEDSSNEIAILAKSFNEITNRLEENIRNLELAKRTLHSVLAKVGEGISSMDNIDSFLSLILETVTEALSGRKGVLLLRDEKREDLYVKSVYGKAHDKSKQIRVDLNDDMFKEIVSSRQPVVIQSVPHNGSPLQPLLRSPLLCAPLLLHDQVLGVIIISDRMTDEPFDEEERNLLHNLALQTAVAVENSRLNEDAEKTYFETISALAMAVEAKDPYSRGHSERVANYAVVIAQEMGMSQEDVIMLRDAAKLHDLGKIGVVDKILKKPGPLTPQEMEMMKKHPEIGEGIIKPIRSLKKLCDLIRHHHEKLDGTGYPDGLTGDQLHPLVRILQVSDIYDALTTNRPYRDPFTSQQAIDTLKSMKDQVDLKVVETLERVVH